jgi:hypothetical protein
MCNFFSAVVTPHGIFWCEKWSHKETRDRLGFYPDAVDVEYDPDRGLEVHEPFRLPDWFDIKRVALECKYLYEKLQELQEFYGAYETAKDKAYERYVRSEREMNERYWEAMQGVHKPRETDKPELIESYRKTEEHAKKRLWEDMVRSKREYEEANAMAKRMLIQALSQVEGYVPPRK